MTERKLDHQGQQQRGGGGADFKRKQQQPPPQQQQRQHAFAKVHPAAAGGPSRPPIKKQAIESIAPPTTMEDKQLKQLVREHFRRDNKMISLKNLIAQGSFGTVIDAEWEGISVIVKVEDAQAVESDSYTLQQEFENYHMLGRDIFTSKQPEQEYAGIPLCLLYSEITSKMTPLGAAGAGMGGRQQHHMARNNGFVSDKIRMLSPEEMRKLERDAQPVEVVKYRLLVLPKLGPNLTQVMRSYPNRRMPPRAVAKVAYQVMQHLEFMHSQGIVHRDIKPENLLLGDEDMQAFGAACLYLIDFGLSKRVWDPKTGRHIPQAPQEGLTGTLRYAGIHTHLRNEASRRDDLQALAYTLLFLLRGSLPWQTSNREDLVGHQEQHTRDNMSLRNFKRSSRGKGGGDSKRFGSLQSASGRGAAAAAAQAAAEKAKTPQEQEALVFKIKSERSIESLIRLPPVLPSTPAGGAGSAGAQKGEITPMTEEDTRILTAIGTLLKYANELEFASMPAYKELREMFVHALGGDLSAIDWSTLD